MTKFSREGVFPGSSRPHLNEAQVIAYLDGELPRPEREAARDHLEVCWTCRGLLTEIENSIDAFLEVRTSLLPEESAFSETRVEQFRQRLARHAGSFEAAPVPLTDRLSSLWIRATHAVAYLLQPRQAAIAGFLVVTMLVIMFTDALNTRVSADTVLARVGEYEAAHLPATGQVSRTAMRVERIERKGHTTGSVEELGTLTVLRDSIRPEMYVQAQTPSGKTGHLVIGDDGRMNEELLGVLLTPEDAAFEQYILNEHWMPVLSADEFRHLGAAFHPSPCGLASFGSGLRSVVPGLPPSLPFPPCVRSFSSRSPRFLWPRSLPPSSLKVSLLGFGRRLQGGVL